MKTLGPLCILILGITSACMPYDLTKMQPEKVRKLYTHSLEEAVYPTAIRLTTISLLLIPKTRN